MDVCLIIEQLKKVLEAKTDKELGEKLGFKQQTVSNWKARNSISLEMLVEVAEKYSVSLDWLITGQRSEQLDALERIALLAFNNLNEEGQKTSAINYMTMLASGKIKGDFNSLWEFAKNSENSTANSVTQTVTGSNVTNLAGGNIVHKK